MRKFSKKVLIALIIVLIVVASASIILINFTSKTGENRIIDIPGINTLNKSFVSASEIPNSIIDFTVNAPQYKLPLSLSSIENLKSVLTKLDVSEKDIELLAKNGFLVINTPNSVANQKIYTSYTQGNPVSPKEDFTAFYIYLKNERIPIFISTDSLLHLYHIFFDTTLKKIEENIFFDYAWGISKFLFDESVKDYKSGTGDLKEAAKRNVAYFGVALSLLKPKDAQILTDEKLKEMYCQGYTEEECKSIIEMVKNAGLEGYFSESDLEKYNFVIPDYAKELIEKELPLIDAHKGWEYSPIFIYREDYSQYVPRGHYDTTEKLKNYFKALMWFGRITYLTKGTNQIEKGKSVCGGLDAIISDYDARMQNMGATLITLHFLSNQDIQNKWSRMYAITSFFVGTSDDLGPQEYAKVIKKNFSTEIKNINEISDKIDEIQSTLKSLPYNPKIYSGLGECKMLMPCPPLSEEDIQNLKIQAKALLEETKGFRLMGQRFTIDSWAFSEIVPPYSGEYGGTRTPLPTNELPFTYTWNDQYPNRAENRPFTWVKTLVEGCGEGREVRGFPMGLDLMAMLDSDRAYEILEELGDMKYSDFDKKFSEIKNEFDATPKSEWYRNIYMNWLYSLKSLLSSFGKGYPTFMQTEAWQDKELVTALSSWAELRHDTILYVKQSYTMAEKGGDEEEPIKGYVEPVPQFYKQLLDLTNLTRNGLGKLLESEQFKGSNIDMFLENLTNNVQRLYEISKKELTGTAPDDSDEYFVMYFGENMDRSIKYLFTGTLDPELLKTPLVADVHTDGNTKLVLEEGIGYIKTILVAHKDPNGKIYLTIGPVFSYYEFKQPMENRLTDSQWKEMLQAVHPEEPSWVKSFAP